MTPVQHRDPKKIVLTAILLTCFTYLCYSMGDAVTKVFGAKFHFSQIIATNCFLTLTFLSVYGGLREGKKAFRTKKWKPMTVRALMSQVVSLCNILALPHVQLTTFYTLVFTSPFIVALLSAVFLKDRPDARRLGVILFGFLAVVLVFRPGGGLMNVWTMAILLGTVCYSCQLVLMRHVGTGESRSFMFMYGAAMGLVWTIPMLPGHFIMPSLTEMFFFIAMAGLNTLGLMCISYAFQTAPSASTVAPYHYTQMIWGALIGWFFFREMPDARVMAGACAVIVAGLYLIYSETRRRVVPDAETAVEV